ncbi:MAG: SRPBCC family protein [Burkholderiaceae bacterium]
MQSFLTSPSGTFGQSPPQMHGVSMRSRNGGGNGGASLAKALGWFSIGLGVAQLLAPRTVSRLAGVEEHPALMRSLGMRELAVGVGALADGRPGPWMWARVAGDAMDLAMLGNAARSPAAQRSRLTFATAAVAGIMALDVVSGIRQSQRAGADTGAASDGSVDVEKCITVNLSADECYQYWRDFANFPRFMKHLELVTPMGDGKSHWKATAPAGTSVEWDAEITADEPGQRLAWRSVGDADVDNAGEVRFERAPGNRGTIVRVRLQYRPPGGMAGAMVAKLFGEEPSQQIDDDLRRFKQLVETGEITTTEGQSSGPRSMAMRLLHKGVQQ